MSPAPDRTTDPLWVPDADRVAAARITAFTRQAEIATHRSFSGYDDLWRWSVSELGEFWGTVWDYFGLDELGGYDEVLADASMPGASWFTGSRVNFAEYLLGRGAADEVAVVAVDEAGGADEWTWQRLRDETAALAATLSARGVGPGDVVVGYLPNIGEAMVAFLSTASLGAAWSCVGQDYAAEAAVDRFAQLSPKMLVTATGYHFGGRLHDRRGEIAALQAGLTSLESTIVVPRPNIPADGIGVPWAQAVAVPAELAPLRVPFDHPLWVLFSSGTTGLPKGLVHGHGGILVETLKHLGLHWDLGPADRLFWYTSPSWVMWNIQVSALALGASVVCYDGSPTHPKAGALWDVVSRHHATFFGTSPGYLQAGQDAGLVPTDGRDLSALRAIGSSGSPLAPVVHRWTSEMVPGVPVWSLSGGTDVVSAFAGGVPTVPVWPGELSAPALGVAMQAWGDDGRPVAPGAVGELVVSQPMPSMPVRLWNDPGHARYRDAYFAMFEHAWRQGDWITFTDRGGVVVHGRSDSTLNRNGVRMGSADIYAAVDSVPGVRESLVIGAEQGDGSYWMPLFVVLEPGLVLDDDLASLIRSRIRDRASPRHVPDEVVAVPGIPHTRTGKKLEVPVKRLLQGAPLDSVANPASIDDPALLSFFAEVAHERLSE